ncbi:DUF262 domain-containing protein [[Flexibacter] sp. ATCC 35208]|uniref:DUF262 domain-containing protein n=1 Tax=[Flexibacter] sp. ATCC 35208 TaxID=1936242 RepID=UPI0009CE4379|nr:DUF262 domain-containing protein [[Flexibacter] sp. ATCC 35208]OMP75084.1 hypothetical protein BW716_31945 [[Flexibacter] sp. ATCC 35208]
MAQSLMLLSIADLLGKQFFIPSYQRGYRWRPQHVNDLLEDLFSFAKKKKSIEEFYCLQPIVVKKSTWISETNEEVSGWEVVDGQQRLTTIRILMEYLIANHLRGATLKSEYKKEVYSIHYQTRMESEQFLQRIEENVGHDIDLYHMSRAYTAVRLWFEKQDIPRDARESMLRMLVYDKQTQQSEGVAQIIWYELNPMENPIDSFVRINLGKIPLTNAELIKALFLQKTNFGPDKNELARLRQLEIANEWDEIENALQQPLFWAFLNKYPSNRPCRIELLLDLLKEVAIEEDPQLVELIGTDDHATFRYFYQLLYKNKTYDDMKSIWGVVIGCFRQVQEWYNTPVWYHYVGFLVASNNEPLSRIYKAIVNEKLPSREAITNMLEQKIKSLFCTVRWALDPTNQDIFLDLTYSKDREKVRQLLLLFNIESIVEQCKNNSIILKFPFESYNGVSIGKGWDVEHIDSLTENELRTKDARKEWLENALIDLESIDESLLLKVRDFLDNEASKEQFENLFTAITKIAKEDRNDELVKDNIGNLALLDAGTNRAYGNALFTTKRRIIIEKDKAGVFIPVCTRNVFLKYYDLAGNTPSTWTSEDVKDYRNAIVKTLERFLPNKPQSITQHA